MVHSGILYNETVRETLVVFPLLVALVVTYAETFEARAFGAFASLVYLLLPSHVTFFPRFHPFGGGRGINYYRDLAAREKSGASDPVITWKEAIKPCGAATGEAYVVVGSGFVGRRLVHALVNRGEKNVTILDMDAKQLGLIKKEYPSGAVKTVCVDVTDVEALRAAFPTKVDSVFATFAQIRYWEHFSKHYERSRRVNVGGIENVCSVAAERGVKRLVATSTSNVLIDETAFMKDGVDEASPRCTPRNYFGTYGMSKAEGEEVVLKRNGTSGMATGVIRPFSLVIGYQDRNYIDLTFSSRAIASHSLTVPNEFVFVDDIVLAHLLLENELRLKGLKSPAAGEAFNINGGGAVEWGLFMAILEREIGRGKFAVFCAAADVSPTQMHRYFRRTPQPSLYARLFPLGETSRERRRIGRGRRVFDRVKGKKNHISVIKINQSPRPG